MQTDGPSRKGANLIPAVAALGGAGIAGLGTVAGACCAPVIAPLTVAVLGAGGAAWAAGLGPYRLALLFVSGALLAGAHLSIRWPWRSKRTECSRRPSFWVPLVVWCGTALWALSVGINLWAA